ncbi:TonB-dependent receptor [Dyadobacter sp. CY323]|uniref:SusC/RagA family TonB-linked outer membrane protein n=1 Tax=Dyadobacter sp. CY323 TaxID=2907302 RepID=UPI001F2505EF|nr:TonB-dependent receptor [Dyadobacter sp. CY323]MCE6990198.1 TonB-dependent receptor [Dyadobacter sp. CY323]
MKTKLRVLLLLVAFGSSIQSGTAQLLASSIKQKPANNKTDTQPTIRQLKDVLLEFKNLYKVDILFVDSMVEGYSVQSDRIVRDNNFERSLHKLLVPLGLTYKKGKNGGYIITKKGDPETKLKNQELNQLEQLAPAETKNPQGPINSAETPGKIPAQRSFDKFITGTIIDAETGAGLPGVNVILKGTTTGTTSDANGVYRISIPDDSKELIFSFVGYESVELPVGGATLNVSLKADVRALNEVVVVSYGTQKKREVTGAVSTLKAETVADMPVAQIGQKLQGQFAGVQVYQSTGTPGAGMSFRIRGQASISAGNTPLYVVDGFPIVGGIERISPEEIESFTVLKDASASSLYGSRAANGVILITTKSAKDGKTRIDFSSYIGVQVVPKRGRPELMNAREFAQFKKEWYEDEAIYSGYTGGVPVEYQNPEKYGPNDGTNWFDVLLRDAPTQNYNLSLSSGTQRLKSTVNLNYNKQDGVMLNTYANRFTLRSNNIYEASDKLTFGINVAVTHQLSQNFTTDGYWNIISGAYLMDPSLNYKNPDGTLPVSMSAPGMFPNPNWYRVLTEQKAPQKRTTAIGNVYGEWSILKDLKYRISLNTDLGNSSLRSFRPSTAGGGMFVAPPVLATGSYNTDNYLSWLVENTLTYSKSIKDHNFDVLVGYNSQKFTSEFSNINATDFPDDAIDWINVATTRIGTAGAGEWSILSMLGRLNYNYKGKYLLSAAMRRDGSSRFGSNNKWGSFPSVSAGWIVSDEDFLATASKLSYLKIRGSYGVVGNNNIGNYTFIPSIGRSSYVFGNQVVAGGSLSGLANQDLGWERTRQLDIGFDLGLFNDRVFFVYDYYKKNTDGLLYNIDIPWASGYSSVTSNVGEFKFWGHEFGLETKNLVGAFRWNSNLNVTVNRNEVMKLGVNNTPIGGYQENIDYVRTEVGHPMGQFYGYIYDGVFMNQAEFDQGAKSVNSKVGSVRIRDVSGPDGKADGKIDVYDKTFIGNPIPKFLFGFSNQFTYKNFDLGIQMAGSVGGDIMDVSYQWTENIDGVFNVRKEVAERWRSEANPGKGNIPRTNSDPLHRFNNSRWIWNGSYLSVKNITLAYNLPLQSKYIKKARIYVTTQNAFILTKYPGMNPEVSDSGLGGLREGVDQASYPVPRVLTAGVNVSF